MQTCARGRAIGFFVEIDRDCFEFLDCAEIFGAESIPVHRPAGWRAYGCSQDVARKEGQSWPGHWKALGSCCTRFQLPRSWCGGRKFRRETRITTAAPAAISGLTMLCNLVGWSLSATTPTAQCNRVLRRACFPSTDYLRRFLARRAMGDIRPTISHSSRASPATSRMSAPRIFTRGGASRRRRSPFPSTRGLNYLKTSMDSQAGSAPNRG